ncbi:hypothetical protein [Streptomyces tailanensis]|uniref:hypothetical protein n=1 Tax=Streptomyces tailanensis TaxID=2569858 RepID=UPI00155AF79F|nr:hypothetical protein [Streptomyces tailanensis]
MRRATVSGWESGKTEPRPPEREAYAWLLGKLAELYPADPVTTAPVEGTTVPPTFSSVPAPAPQAQPVPTDAAPEAAAMTTAQNAKTRSAGNAVPAAAAPSENWPRTGSTFAGVFSRPSASATSLAITGPDAFATISMIRRYSGLSTSTPHAFLAIRDQPYPTRPGRHHHRLRLRLRLHDARRPPSPVRRLGPLPEHHLGRLQPAQLGLNLRQFPAQQLGPLSQSHPPLDRPRQHVHHAPPSRCGTYETPRADHLRTREPARGRRSPANDHVREQRERVNLHPHQRPDL